jgi:hypothetical protein
VEVGITGQIDRTFLARNFILHQERSLMSLDVESLWRLRAELKSIHKGPSAYRPRCDGVVAPWPRPQSRYAARQYRRYRNGLNTLHQCFPAVGKNWSTRSEIWTRQWMPWVVSFTTRLPCPPDEKTPGTYRTGSWVDPTDYTYDLDKTNISYRNRDSRLGPYIYIYIQYIRHY